MKLIWYKKNLKKLRNMKKKLILKKLKKVKNIINQQIIYLLTGKIQKMIIIYR